MSHNTIDHRASKIAWSALSLVFALFFGVPDATAQDFKLLLTAQPPSNGSTVEFIAQPSGTVSSKSLGDASLVPSSPTQHGYIIRVDNASFRQDKNHRYVADLYVTLNPNEPGSDLYKFIVWENPGGKFLDSWTNLSVVLLRNDMVDTTNIRLPIHCADSDNIQLDVAKPLAVSMGGENPGVVGLKNSLSDLRLNIQSATAIQIEDRNCPKCWLSLTGSVPHSNLNLNGKTTLDLKFKPNTLQILKQNFLPPPSDAPPYQLIVSIVSIADKGGFDVSQELSIPIKFTPAPGFLALSLLIGIIVGLCMRALINQKIDWFDFVLQFLLAVVVWLILIAVKAKLSLFGFDFDPTSLIAAAIITLVIAGGPQVGSKIAMALKKGNA